MLYFIFKINYQNSFRIYIKYSCIVLRCRVYVIKGGHLHLVDYYLRPECVFMFYFDI